VDVQEAMAVTGLHVLIVDDEPRVREALTVLLQLGGATVTAVPSAADAMLALKDSPCDVVISDIGMPEEDGFSFMQRLRNLTDAEGANVPAIALTAHARAEDQSRAAEVGFDLHLAKPVEADVLIGAIARLARKGPSARATITR
jgi:CheY-like chemotaxis protein